MGAGTSPADPAPAGRAADGPDGAAEPSAARPGGGSAGRGDGDSAERPADDSASASAEQGGGEPAERSAGASASDPGSTSDPGSASAASAEQGGAARGRTRSRRFPRFTRDTARPEGGGRAASGDAPAPARQWPLLTVLCAAGLGLLIVALDPFAEAFRIGTILIGCALITGAVLRWAVPSVGMLAVRSRFTDLVTYGLMGTLIVLLALVAQPRPWLDVPILEDAVRFTIR
ncbi:DUF3017 domain-containing protein [Streptomyces californicus]|uniref:DUF3017 domain-containing protein n=1 Tax=Streptomyces californicus TaxID=67351 RepID=UPI00296E728B|nr:DUF3017 domain-containing protein [Streptomyces californicus]MDW4912212.1 DUF3017 domain-containing protein [Streptomyces californicus]